ncbi:MAG: hypothetical protein L0Z50_39230 [Verrucomicrobiales bacterium]|nr:hypothetical protein [Verrucomicrobiales bacterium]
MNRIYQRRVTTLPTRIIAWENGVGYLRSGNSRREGGRDATKRSVRQTLEGPRCGGQTSKEKERSMNGIYQGKVMDVAGRLLRIVRSPKAHAQPKFQTRVN